MKLYIQQKVFSFKNKFSVKDESGMDRYFIEGEVLSIGRKLHITGIDGSERAVVCEKVFTFLPKFSVLVNDVEVTEIAKKFTLFKPKYILKGLNWEVHGDILSRNYTITNNSAAVGAIHKKWMSWGDTFEIDLAEGADEIMALAVVLAIDCVLDSQNRGHRYD